MQDAKEIGSKIKQLRKNKRMSRTELAEKIGVSPSAITNYENGDRIPRDEVKVKIAKVLGKSITSIFF